MTKKRAPVRKVKKSTLPNSGKVVSKEQEVIPESEPKPEKEIVPEVDNVVPFGPVLAPEIVTDPVNVFQLIMLENELEKTQLKMQVTASKAAEQVNNAIAHRDKSLAGLQALFNKYQTRWIKLKEYVEEKHGISLKHYVYDDETGVFKKVKALEKGSGGTEGE